MWLNKKSNRTRPTFKDWPHIFVVCTQTGPAIVETQFELISRKIEGQQIVVWAFDVAQGQYKGVFVFLFSWPIAESDSVTKKTILNRLFTAFAFKFVPIKSKDKSSCQNSIE
jgi:hypothetical protein